MRLGIFGGTFDPVHLGHLILAEQCREQARLDRVSFIPAAQPPHKLERELTSFDRRAEMLRLAVSGNKAFQVNEIENSRPGPSYTADTLALLHEKNPKSQLFLILGADAVCDLPIWHEPKRIVAAATLVVCARPGFDLPPMTELAARIGLGEHEPIQHVRVESPLIEIASRDIRRRVAQARSVRYLVPRAVEAYIRDKKLYLG